MRTTENISEEYLDKIISVAYGDAGFVDEIKIYLDSKRNPEVKKLLNEYKKTARGVNSLSQEKYKGDLPVKGPQLSNWLLVYFSIFIRKPVLSAALALMITAGVAGYYIINQNSVSYDGYTPSEMALAEKQAKESFAIVASIMNRTKDQLEKNVFENKINKPIKKSLTVVNTYL